VVRWSYEAGLLDLNCETLCSVFATNGLGFESLWSHCLVFLGVLLIIINLVPDIFGAETTGPP